MTYLRSATPSVDNVFQLPRPRVRVAALGFVVRRLRRWRQVVEARRAQRHLMQLDDRLLSDIGLSRTDVCFGDFETVGRRSDARHDLVG